MSKVTFISYSTNVILFYPPRFVVFFLFKVSLIAFTIYSFLLHFYLGEENDAKVYSHQIALLSLAPAE